MSTTITGFDGTIDETAFARGQAQGAHRGVVSSRASFAATPVPNARQLRLSGGSAYDAGVLVEVTDAVAATVDIPGPSAGQWFLVVMRRNWDTNGVTYLALTAALTTTVEPRAVPAVLPEELEDRPGIVTDQPLYWAWARSGQTSLVLVDMRTVPPSLARRGTMSQRTAYYGLAPTAPAAQRALQGAEWFNTDTNLHEVYMASYDAATNPGGLPPVSPAGWYSVGVNGREPAIYGRIENSKTLVPGEHNDIGALDLDPTQGRLYRFVHWMRWMANGNTAATMRALLDGEEVGNPVRVHTQGGPARFAVVQLEHILWLPPGKHRISTEFYVEGSSASSTKMDSTITGFGVGRS